MASTALVTILFFRALAAECRCGEGELVTLGTTNHGLTELNIESFSIFEDIMAEGISAPSFNPIDESNDDPFREALGDAIGDILDL